MVRPCNCERCQAIRSTRGLNERSKYDLSDGLDARIYEELTIQAMRIVEFMRTCQCDADMVQNEFIGEIGDYERSLARREDISI